MFAELEQLPWSEHSAAEQLIAELHTKTVLDMKANRAELNRLKTRVKLLQHHPIGRRMISSRKIAEWGSLKDFVHCMKQI